MKQISFVTVALFVLAGNCKPAGGPVIDAEAGAVILEAGLPIANDVCTLLEGLDSSGTLSTICATLDEVAQVVDFLLTLRGVTDAGPSLGETAICTPIPGEICATKQEIGKAISYLVQHRRARFLLDGGTR